MASSYPTSLDTFTNPTSTDKLNSPDHATQHSDVNDAIEALEKLIGTNASQTAPTGANRVLASTSASASAWTADPTLNSLTINSSSVALITIETDTANTLAKLKLDSGAITGSGDATQIQFDENGVNKAYIGTRGNDNFFIYVGGADAVTIDSSQNITISSGNLTVTGDINPEADGTRDLGTQTTAQWANLWADLVNGADIAMANKWRMVEAELYTGYPQGWALGHNKNWKDGVSLWKNPEMVGDEKPTFVVTDDFIEYKGRRITPEILDKLLCLIK